MPTPRINNRRAYRGIPTYSGQNSELKDTRQELSQRIDRLEKTLDTTRQELSQRMDRIEHRMDKLEEKFEITRQEIREVRKELNARMDKQDDKIDRLAYKIDAMHNELKSSTGHISIANISTVGIALGVLYTLLFK